MALTQNQLNSLRYDLQALANIEYDDVLTELLDHYATLTEQEMTHGLPFDEASKWAWAKLGSGEGLSAIQANYAESMRQQVRGQHIEILKSYFRWPAFVTTALVGLLVYLAVPLMPVRFVIGILFLLSISPTSLVMWGRQKLLDQHTDARRIIWQYLETHGAFGGQIVCAAFNLTGVFSANSSTQSLFQVHMSVAVVVCLLLLLYTASFVQLFREKFIYKPKSA